MSQNSHLIPKNDSLCEFCIISASKKVRTFAAEIKDKGINIRM